MNEEQKTLVNDWIKAYYDSCPLCLSHNLEIKDDFFELKFQSESLIVCVVCKDCAHINLFDATTMGIIIKPKLQTLREHNSGKMSFSGINTNPCLNGIECPDCKSELWDTNPSVSLSTHPAKKQTHCENCKYTGYRLA
jgi:C4-type Zn-finger protein